MPMRLRAPADWKGDETKERVVQNFLFPLVKKNRAATLALFELVNEPLCRATDDRDDSA